MTSVLLYTPTSNSEDVLGSITRVGDQLFFAGPTRRLFASLKDRYQVDSAVELFDQLSDGWSNGYSQLIPASPKE